MAKKILEWPDESVLSEIILKVLSQQDQPKTAKDIRKQLVGPFKLPEARLLELLTSLAAKGNLFEWPAKGKGPLRYWKGPLSPEFISEKIVQALTEKSLRPLELKKILARKLFGLSQRTIDPVIHSLLLQGTIIQHPKMGGVKAKLGQGPPDPKPYLQKVQKELDQVVKMLAPARVSREEINKALWDLLGLYTTIEPPTDELTIKVLENRIISKMVEIEPQARYGALVSLRNLRRSLDIKKDLFDGIIIDLAKKNQLILHRHSFPQGLSQEERDFLVEDQKGNWYVGAVLMDHGK